MVIESTRPHPGWITAYAGYNDDEGSILLPQRENEIKTSARCQTADIRPNVGFTTRRQDRPSRFDQ